MSYKLLALDVDGTLINNHKEITSHTRDAILTAQKEYNIRIILTSGRPTYGVLPIAEQLHLAEYGSFVISYNGGEIMDCRTQETIYARTLDRDVLPYLYQCARKHQFAIVTYHKEYVITEAPEDEYVLKQAVLSVMKLKKVDSFLSAITFPIVKCLIVGEPSRLVALEDEISKHLQHKISICRSEPYFLELTPLHVNKANSLAILLNRLNIPSTKLIACGDGLNDITMIKYAGLGVAMGNAQTLVCDQADYVTLTNDEDGIAHVIENFIFKLPTAGE